VIVGVLGGGFVSWHLAMFKVRIDRAERGWRRKT
jgi:hypothetical protein